MRIHLLPCFRFHYFLNRNWQSKNQILKFYITESAKFRGSRAIMPSWLRGSEIFSRGYFVGTKFFLVNISWVTREYISEEYE